MAFNLTKLIEIPAAKRLYLVIKTDLKTRIKLKFSLCSDQYFKRNRGKKVVQESPIFFALIKNVIILKEKLNLESVKLFGRVKKF